ncbi:hypothetical protein [Pseudofrankia asymbiotica]|uniref:hypothetical protein n=1 Tax=Pseudofrankia asymbiotica TaxID=1834516 RepID=UPI0018E99B43|nr:hypothetical protein [Pseudofrankia asymbiotica]
MLATLTAFAIPPFTSADEAQHTSYALEIGSGSLPMIDTPVRSLLPGMPGIPADCVVTSEQARAGLEAARARLAHESGSGHGSAAAPGAGTREEPRPGETGRPATSSPPLVVPVVAETGATQPGRPTNGGTGTASQPTTGGAGAAPGPASGTGTVPRPTAGGARSARPLSVAVEMASAGGMPACAHGPRGVHSNTQLTYTANHPPLFYAIQSVPLTTGIHSGHPIAGFHAARLLNVGFGIAALAALAWLVRELVPARPDLAVGAAAVMGTVGMFVNSCGQLYNDGLSLVTIIASLAATVALLRRGPSATRLLCLAVAVLAAAATRASGLVEAGLLLPVAGIAVALHTRGRWRRLGFGIATVAGGAAVVCAGVGWFYWRNIQLYGDLTASGLIAKMFPISEKPMTADEILHSRVFAWAIYRGFYGRPRLLSDGRDLTDGPKLVLLVLAAGLTLAALRWAARQCVALWARATRLLAARRAPAARSPQLVPAAQLPAPLLALPPAREAPDDSAPGLAPEPDPGSDPRPAPEPCPARESALPGTRDLTARLLRVGRRRAPGVVAWVLIMLHVAVAGATLVGYVAAGGAWFARYLLPAVPVATLLLAAALAALPGARRGLPTVVAVAALAAMTAVMTGRELAFKLPALHQYDTVNRLRSALIVSGVHVPTFTLWTLGLAALTGLALLAAAMWSLSTAVVPTWPVPRPRLNRRPAPTSASAPASALASPPARPPMPRPVVAAAPATADLTPSP